mgnify:CR=1 FL=1
MIEQIEKQLQEWQTELDQLMAHQRKLEQARSDNETSIQRHVGAITGAQQLLEVIRQTERDAPQDGDAEEGA